ncbi:MAG: hypothetical protein CBD18_03565 [Opitutales bacterium TMED158]|nr:MAG: hypothetical protein CBD18_03565 [Opitutales bacterium TMED158]
MRKCRLIYESKATPALLETHELNQLLSLASERNRLSGITGQLVLTGDHFLQALEGPTRYVNQLYNKIVADSRHTEIELISYQSIDAALFYDWTMRLIDLKSLPGEVKKLMLQKYPHIDDVITIPNNEINALSLLIDARSIGLSAET